jgi:hypothetical protein
LGSQASTVGRVYHDDTEYSRYLCSLRSRNKLPADQMQSAGVEVDLVGGILSQAALLKRDRALVDIEPNNDNLIDACEYQL